MECIKKEGDFQRSSRASEMDFAILPGIPSFGGERTFSHHQAFPRDWIRKSFLVGWLVLTVLKSILPGWWWENAIHWNATCLPVMKRFARIARKMQTCCQICSDTAPSTIYGNFDIRICVNFFWRQINFCVSFQSSMNFYDVPSELRSLFTCNQ